MTVFRPRYSRRMLLADAHRAGLSVETAGLPAIFPIVIRAGRQSVVLYRDGTIHRGDMALALTHRIRPRQAAIILGLHRRRDQPAA